MIAPMLFVLPILLASCFFCQWQYWVLIHKFKKLKKLQLYRKLQSLMQYKF